MCSSPCRAVNGAKAYLKKVGADKVEITMMMVSLFAKSMPKYLDEWEKLTGIKVKTIEYGYTEIPAKIMADAVAKSGQYDIYNHQMYMLPDAADANAIIPLDDYAARGKPYFDDIPKTLRTEMYYKGKLYTFFTDGGRKYIGFTAVTTDGTGNASFTFATGPLAIGRAKALRAASTETAPQRASARSGNCPDGT